MKIRNRSFTVRSCISIVHCVHEYWISCNNNIDKSKAFDTYVKEGFFCLFCFVPLSKMMIKTCIFVHQILNTFFFASDAADEEKNHWSELINLIDWLEHISVVRCIFFFSFFSLCISIIQYDLFLVFRV